MQLVRFFNIMVWNSTIFVVRSFRIAFRDTMFCSLMAQPPPAGHPMRFWAVSSARPTLSGKRPDFRSDHSTVVTIVRSANKSSSAGFSIIRGKAIMSSPSNSLHNGQTEVGKINAMLLLLLSGGIRQSVSMSFQVLRNPFSSFATDLIDPQTQRNRNFAGGLHIS